MGEIGQKKIRVGQATVGLIGLGQAVQQAMSLQLQTDAAADFLLEALGRNNYIPASARELYRKALRAEYGRAASGEAPASGDHQLSIKILGPGCVSCNKLNSIIFDLMQHLEIAADIEQIHDLDEIWRHGVISTPALIINGAIKCSGRMPTPAEVEQWLLEAGRP